MATYYMHTLNNHPAGFFEGRSVCYAGKRIPLAYSLRQIQREQQVSKRWHGDEPDLKYGYVTVIVPAKLPCKRHPKN